MKKLNIPSKVSIAAASLTLTFMLTTGLPAYADGDESKIIPTIGRVVWQDGLSFELKNVQLVPDQTSQLATYTVIVHNDGNFGILLSDYWIRLKSRSGSFFPTKMNPVDKDKQQIAPHSSQEISFYANVNDSTKLQELVFQINKWNFSLPGYEQHLGEISIPADYSMAVPAGSSQTLLINGVPVDVQVSRFLTNKNENNNVPTVYIKLVNTGRQPTKVSGYIFYMRSSDGRLYPLEAKEDKDMTINSNDSAEIQLFGSIPTDVTTNTWELVMSSTVKDKDLIIHLPVASFQLPQITQPEVGITGQDYTFVDQNGLYTAQLKSLNRQPLNDQDMLTAELVFRNQGDHSLPIPNLTGYFLLDGGIKIEAKMIQMAKSIGMNAGESLTVQFIGKLPYTTSFTDVKLFLQQIEEGVERMDVLSFSNLKVRQDVPYVDQTETYTISEAGRRSKYAIAGTTLYESSSSELFVTQVHIENLEKRYSYLPKLVGYYRSKDGSIFPATIQVVDSQLNPSSKAQVTAWTRLPKGYSTKGLQLVLGEAIQTEAEGILQNNLTNKSNTQNNNVGRHSSDVLYVKPVAYWLPDAMQNVMTQLKDVNLYPFSISLSQIATSISGNEQGINELTLKFNYEIIKDTSVEANLEGHKLILSFEDHDGRMAFERAYDVKDFEPKALDDDQAGKTRLLLGKHDSFAIKIIDKDLIYQQQFLKQYTLKMYDEFQGHRNLLASQKNDWFATTD